MGVFFLVNNLLYGIQSQSMVDYLQQVVYNFFSRDSIDRERPYQNQ